MADETVRSESADGLRSDLPTQEDADAADGAVTDKPASSASQLSQPQTQDTGAPTSSSATEQATQVSMLDGAADDPATAAAAAAAAADPARPQQQQRDMAVDIAEAEARIPQKKDATLREFLGKMDDYAPIIPDAVTNHYLTLAGLPPPPTTPPHLAHLLALATQKFVADIAADAYQYARIRSTHTTSNTATAMMGVNMGLPGQAPAPQQGNKAGGDAGKAGQVALGVQRAGFGGGQGAAGGRTVLTMEDLGMAVGEYGVNVRRGEFYR